MNNGYINRTICVYVRGSVREERDRVELVQKSQSRPLLHSTLFHDAPKAPSHFLVFRRLFSSPLRVEKGDLKTAALLLSEERRVFR